MVCAPNTGNLPFSGTYPTDSAAFISVVFVACVKKASKAFGALRDRIFSTRDVSERLKGKIYTGGVLAVLLYGCELWCLTAESISRLRNWHNKHIREMCRVTMCQSSVHQISPVSLQKRTGVFSIEYYLASHTLLWAGHVARMPKSRLPKRHMLPWVREPRIKGVLVACAV